MSWLSLRWGAVNPRDEGFAAFFDKILQSLEDAINGHLDSINIADEAVTTAKIDDLAVTTGKLAASAVTTAKAADGVAIVASGTYTGDGTQNRNITTGFRPRYVIVLRHTTPKEFISLGTAAGLLASWYKDAAGTITGGGAGDADWQGATTDGFLCGSAVGGGFSNEAAIVYSYFASR